MSTEPLKRAGRGQPTESIAHQAPTAADQFLRADGPSNERDALTERLESGLDYIEFTDLTSGAVEISSTPGLPHTEFTAAKQVGEYLLVREIGRGGMGVVYEAVQPGLARRVALKILPYSRTLDARQLMRFRNESLAAARLDHPNIVRVISVGQDCGMHYYAMQYVEGESLAEVLAKIRRTELRQDDRTQFAAISEGFEVADDQPDDGDHASSQTVGPEFFRRIAEWGVQAADALDHAHAVGVIHRDIKPSNLLLDSTGRILIADFGVALMQNAPELTMTGDLLGTARYMSPEQWQGKPGLVDHRADIYSLGATLYELLTLRPVLKGDDREQLHRQIVDETPIAPRNLVRSIPRDLETIVLKALAKDRDERYATAQEMADDLRRFLNDHPIRARRPTLPQRVFRWARRHRTLVAAGVALLALVTLVLAATTSFVLMQREQIKATAAENGKLLTEERETKRRLARVISQLRDHLYSANLRLAYRAWHTADVGLATQMLRQQNPVDAQIDRRGFEWRLLWRMLHAHHLELTGHESDVYATAWSADGKWLATAGSDTMVRIWNTQTRQQRLLIEEHSTDVNGLAFRGDGEQLATACEDGAVRLFNVANGKLEATLSDHVQGVFCVRYAPGSDLLVSAGRGGIVRLWDSRSHQEIDQIAAHDANVEAIDISSDGKLLATASRDDTIRLWDMKTRLPVSTLLGHRDTVLAVAFSPDGRRLASGGEDYSVLVWNIATSSIDHQMQGHDEWVQSVAFAADGKVVVSASKDSTVRLWDASTGQSLEVVRGHRGRVWNATVSPDGQTLATAGADGKVKLWHWSDVQKYARLNEEGQPFTALAVSPDGQTFAAATVKGTLLLCETSSGRVKHRLPAHAGGCNHLAFTADGTSLVTAGSDRKVRLWDTVSGKLAGELGQCDRPIQALWLHPLWQQVVCLCGAVGGPSKLETWHLDDPAAGKVTLNIDIGTATCGQFSPEGTWLVLGRPDGDLVALDWRQQQLTSSWPAHDNRVSQICFNESGTLMATAASDGLVKIWSWPDGVVRHTMPGHSAAVRALAFTHDGRTLASGGDDGVVRLWNVSTGQEITMLATFIERLVDRLVFLPQDRGLMAISNFSDGDSLVSWFADGTSWPHSLLKPADQDDR